MSIVLIELSLSYKYQSHHVYSHRFHSERSLKVSCTHKENVTIPSSTVSLPSLSSSSVSVHAFLSHFQLSSLSDSSSIATCSFSHENKIFRHSFVSFMVSLMFYSLFSKLTFHHVVIYPIHTYVINKSFWNTLNLNKLYYEKCWQIYNSSKIFMNDTSNYNFLIWIRNPLYNIHSSIDTHMPWILQ